MIVYSYTFNKMNQLNIKQRVLLFSLLLLLINPSLFGQSITPTQKEAINAIFADYKETPAVAYGVIYKGELLTKTFQDEQYACFSQDQEKFRLGGMAQHFTAYAILHLIEQGKFQLNDSIDSYLDFGHKDLFKGITIHDLLSHASGLPEYWTLKELYGYGENDPFSTEDGKKLFNTSLNRLFKAKEKFSYSGTGAFLLARIIENETGQDMATFTKEHIFIPLKMEHTYFVESKSPYSSPIGYLQDGSNYIPHSEQHNDAGPAGLVTTMEDMLMWIQHLDTKKSSIFRKMDQLITYVGDKIVEVPDGKMTYGQQFMHMERGINKIWDYGHLGGFASSVFRFPSQELSIVIMSKNGMSYNGFLGMQISDVFLKDEYETEVETEAPKEISLTKDLVAHFTGNYFSPESYNFRQIIVVNDTLRYYNHSYNTQYTLTPISKTEVLLKSGYGEDYILKVQEKKLAFHTPEHIYHYDKIPAINKNLKKQKALVGTYYNDEIYRVFKLELEQDQLVLIDKDNRVSLQAINSHQYVSASNQFKLLTLTYDENQQIEGVQISNSGYKDILFKKGR